MQIKINISVKIEKDNFKDTAPNKKDKWLYEINANDEARKLAEKGANCACIEDKIVWLRAIHYFEDSIEGNFFYTMKMGA